MRQILVIAVNQAYTLCLEDHVDQVLAVVDR